MLASIRATFRKSTARSSRPASTGKLGIVCACADYIEQSNALKQKILLAFTYPGIVTLIAFGIVTFLLSYVVPQVVNVFASTKQQLPVLTIVMMALSDFVRHWWWAILIAVVLVVCVREGDAVARRAAPRVRPLGAHRAARGQARARLQHGALREHARHPHRGGRADPARVAGGRRDAV